ncbi:hypothetical protein K466DRAFT_250844 [Polyporus arcularius HHB13444]|uniref:Uncharacterized protein n=1 Tax=Polyporus arcularius HHB13444 TaxID=1314778 RepID=A0A5C3P405_9APHY|nr:hypothetical protein K466DRAFT_250844 [Polyporus arcularius HHB13444]
MGAGRSGPVAGRGRRPGPYVTWRNCDGLLLLLPSITLILSDTGLSGGTLGVNSMHCQARRPKDRHDKHREEDPPKVATGRHIDDTIQVLMGIAHPQSRIRQTAPVAALSFSPLLQDILGPLPSIPPPFI